MIAPTFEVVGTPAPQGSHTAMMLGGKPRVVDGSSRTGREKHQTWRQAVMEAAKDWLDVHPQPPIDEPMTLIIEFRMPRGKAAKYRTRHTTSPDLDKAVRSVGDSLTDAQMIIDDSRIWRHRVEKRYVIPGQLPGAIISLELDGEAELDDRERMKIAAALARKGIRPEAMTHPMLPL